MSGLFGALGKMAKGADIGAQGNGIFCVSRLGAAPSLHSGLVVLMFALALLLSGSSVISHVSQPSADMILETVSEALSVFAGETESGGRFSGLVEQVVVELGGFVHFHAEIISVAGQCEFLVFSLLAMMGLVTGINTVAGMSFETVFHGCWLAFGSCVHSSVSSSLSPSLLSVVNSWVAGTQDCSLLMSRCPCSVLLAGDAGCEAEFEGID